jgi:hypothetical protein
MTQFENGTSGWLSTCYFVLGQASKFNSLLKTQTATLASSKNEKYFQIINGLEKSVFILKFDWAAK